MKSMVIGGIILIIALMAGTYFVAGDAFISDDYINALTFLGAAAIITISTFVVLKYVNQMKNDTASGDLAEENWDGIGEYKNKVPTGWAIAFIGTIIWMFWYMTIGYPVTGFSQIGQWNEETNEYNAKFQQKWVNPSEDTLKAMGQSVFLVQCAPCHGNDAEGINGKAHDLTKRISKEQVEFTIRNGANNLKESFPAGMPPMMLTEDADISAVSAYVAGGFKGEQPVAYATCAACHGDNGEGMPFVGPNIKSYDEALVMAVLKEGKIGSIGQMPSFTGRLNETQEKALASYLRSLGGK
ncbi:cytochrome c oxidase CcoNOPQ, cbb3-type, membrane-bound monoheme cytochrome c subunit III [Aliarcobacter faecis]|uniref:c-type cytochrome n=1 Tax=Aliarcobacter faecis TaxID=1564138 RepID=UPI00047EBC0D|nr:c-type cytochrome [Aliarcobacter faecis]QKF72455.1 cytochrome c oxidase CcoNOPQ, cbb3-type, membrane-bound monoheme cytochrome c subunit III [Aliarcobacter faecis]